MRVRRPARVTVGLLTALVVLAGCSSATPGRPSSSPAPTTSATNSAHTTAPATTTVPAQPSTRHTSTTPRTTSARPRPPTTHSSSTARQSAQAGSALPLDLPTGNAQQVITVRAGSTGDTSGTLQTWQRSGSGWRRIGPAVRAHLGEDGLTPHPSESRSATPIGSFTLTQAFGRNSNPGTGLPYFKTTPADWWISQTTGTGARYYNTHQHCSSGCPFIQGAPNENLYYETPYYNYAVVIDTPSGAGAIPHGSAFFLHVTDGRPTAGCVAIAEDQLLRVLRWLEPSAHPRILIGIG